MSLVFQYEIRMRQFDKAGKNRPIIEQIVFSSDSHGKPRYFHNPTSALQSAIRNAHAKKFGFSLSAIAGYCMALFIGTPIDENEEIANGDNGEK